MNNIKIIKECGSFSVGLVFQLSSSRRRCHSHSSGGSGSSRRHRRRGQCCGRHYCHSRCSAGRRRCGSSSGIGSNR